MSRAHINRIRGTRAVTFLEAFTWLDCAKPAATTVPRSTVAQIERMSEHEGGAP
jgi:hypothetical protein